MNVRLVCLISTFALLPLANAAEQKEAAGRYLATPLKGDYYVYGGSLGDSTPPTEKDRKLSLMLTGPLAKDFTRPYRTRREDGLRCRSRSSTAVQGRPYLHLGQGGRVFVLPRFQCTDW